MGLLAYFLTFTSYGTHLPGSKKGWVAGKQRLPGSPLRAGNTLHESYWSSRLNEAPWILDTDTREVVLQSMVSVCAHRNWIIYAIHVRGTHVHAVIGGEAKPERMLSALKASATHTMRSGNAAPRTRYWTYHGSTRYLWNQSSLEAAVEYVLNGQGPRMSCYPNNTVTQ